MASIEVSCIEADLMCGICHEILMKPVELACNHLFCKFCIVLWLKQQPVCPMCRAPVPEDPGTPGHLVVSTVNSDRVIDHVVKSLPPIVQEQRRAAKRHREQAEEEESAAKRRRLAEHPCACIRVRTRWRYVSAATSMALVALLGSLTWLL